jgi:hypothetical protein
MLEGRNEHGKFVKGAWQGGPGRPPKAHEDRYRGIFSETITPEKFRASCLQVWLDSVGKKLNPDGKMVEDSNSTPAARVNAFTRLASFALGRPVQPILVDSADGDLLARFREMSSEHLDSIIAEAQRIVNSAEKR